MTGCMNRLSGIVFQKKVQLQFPLQLCKNNNSIIKHFYLMFFSCRKKRTKETRTLKTNAKIPFHFAKRK